MITDQLVEFETKSKEIITIWETLLEKIDLFPIGLYIALWLCRKMEAYLKYSEQFFQEVDFFILSILALPLFFWWLYSRNLKFGWFLRSSFYLFVSTVIIRIFISKHNLPLFAYIVYGLLLIASSVIVVNSFRPVHLHRLKIDTIILVFVSIVDIGIILGICLY